MKENGRLLKNKNYQSILDFVLAFMAVSLLAVGIVRIWVWFNANYAGRQIDYQSGRLDAGRPDTPGLPAAYQPLDLDEEWVFAGKPTKTISGEDISGVEKDPLEVCKEECGEEPDPSCLVRCLCRKEIEPKIILLNDSVKALRDTVNSLKDSAKSMREQAENCDDPWEICWWGDWGKTPSELRRAAKRIDRQANSLRRRADSLEKYAQDSLGCCNLSTAEEQEICAKKLERRAKKEECDVTAEECVNKCREDFEDAVIDCFKNYPRFWHWKKRRKCLKAAEESYRQCVGGCGTEYRDCLKEVEEMVNCSEMVENIVLGFNEKLEDIRESKEMAKNHINEISTTISNCESYAINTCQSSCKTNCWTCDAEGNCSLDSSCYEKCYNDCYLREKNECCKKNCCGQTPWEKDCNELLEEKKGAEEELEELESEEKKTLKIIKELPNCCQSQKFEEQIQCIEEKLKELR